MTTTPVWLPRSRACVFPQMATCPGFNPIQQGFTLEDSIHGKKPWRQVVMNWNAAHYHHMQFQETYNHLANLVFDRRRLGQWNLNSDGNMWWNLLYTPRILFLYSSCRNLLIQKTMNLLIQKTMILMMMTSAIATVMMMTKFPKATQCCFKTIQGLMIHVIINCFLWIITHYFIFLVIQSHINYMSWFIQGNIFLVIPN